MEMLTAWAIPMWLTGIKLSRVAPEKRPAILAFKREAADALYRHFSRPQEQLVPPSTLVPAEPIAKPEQPARGAPLADWRTFHEAMVAWIDWQADIEQWRGSVESRLGTVEEITRLVPEILERLGPAMLSPEHQATVRNGIKRLHDLTGRAYGSLYTELGEHFHVAKYDQIPEARWDEVVAWFRVRFDRAGGQDPEQGSLF
jgi:hypothetical protein